ncbi:hypothetical protein PAESOLCIP111_01033 [Paenibacillus solanacearum]|uniref:Extracellular solute-binding protein n=1 Tax=Paenibacillus solanacearum TaxID=2048548 RepID=A0A916NVJ4_9BACL|nr:extracellular solute-binding protein [Paenibacillus solanacearum]CAG7608169.1 hypothetical protein PAESOLCIP111_01033 [Paenibacillus solanacearum]
MSRKLMTNNAVILFVCAIIGGCGGSAPAANDEVKAKEPVTLNFFAGQNVFVDFEKFIAEPIKAKYPHITLHLIKNEKGSDYGQLIATGTTLDIIYESAAFTVDKIMTNGLEYDLDELMKKHKFDLNQFEPNVLAQSQNSNVGRKIYGLPFLVNKYVMIYNKDVFDRFGVPYPKDGMTWDETYELTKKLSLSDGGTDYRGFNTTPNLMMLNNQLSVSPLHVKEDRAEILTDNWVKLMNNLKRFFEIPANNTVLPIDDFSKGHIAMTVHNTNPIANWQSSSPDLKWDIVSAPVMKEKPGIGFKPATLALFIGKTSQHKDEAFQVIQELVSEKIQLNITKQGFGSPLASQQVKQAFGQDVPLWKGKNTKAIYFLKDAPASEPRADGLTSVDVNFTSTFNKLVKEGLDVNTALRQLEEDRNNAIKTAKSDAK